MALPHRASQKYLLAFCDGCHSLFLASSRTASARKLTVAVPKICCLLAHRQILTAATPYSSLYPPPAALGNVPPAVCLATGARGISPSPPTQKSTPLGVLITARRVWNPSKTEWNQREALNGIKPQRRYTYGNAIRLWRFHTRCRVMPYQACGLDKNKGYPEWDIPYFWRRRRDLNL